MNRVFIAYITAGLGLFGALFASFALTGLGRPESITQDPAAQAAEAANAAKPPAPLPGAFVPPTLDPGRAYTVSHDTPIYSEPTTEAHTSQTLRAQGSFTAVRTLDSPPGPWLEIAIDDRTMYLFTPDLRWKILTPVYSPEERATRRRDTTLEQVIASGGLLGAARQPEAAPPPPPPPREFSQWWADKAEQLGGADAASLLVSGIAAGITTALTLGAIALLSLFRRKNTWSHAAEHLDSDNDDPYSYAYARIEGEENEDEDPRRA